CYLFFFSSRRRHTRFKCDWSSDVCSSDLTAGRLLIDEPMLEELRAIRKEVAPHHVLLVVDAMTGQDAVTVADRFNKAVGIDAVKIGRASCRERVKDAVDAGELTTSTRYVI